MRAAFTSYGVGWGSGSDGLSSGLAHMPSICFSLTLGKSLGPFLHDYLGFLIAWRLNSKGVFQDVKAETADLIRSGLRIYTASFLPHSVDQSKAPPSPVQGKRK